MKEITNNVGLIEAALSGRKRTADGNPVVMWVVGRPGAGKSSFIKDKVGDAFIHVDAGAIFFDVGGEAVTEFPDTYLDDVHEVGSGICSAAIAGMLDIVVEFSGSDTVRMQVLMRALEDLGYDVIVKYVRTDLNQATIRSLSDESNDVSATEKDDFHHRWLIDAVNGFVPPIEDVPGKDPAITRKKRISSLFGGHDSKGKASVGTDQPVDRHDELLHRELAAAPSDREISIRLSDDTISPADIEELEIIRAHRHRLAEKYAVRKDAGA